MNKYCYTFFFGREMQLLASFVCCRSFQDIPETLFHTIIQSLQKETGHIGDAASSNDMETFTCLLAGLSSHDEIWSGQSF